MSNLSTIHMDHRLVDYFAVVGLSPDAAQIVSKRTLRQRSEDILQISVVTPEEKAMGFTTINYTLNSSNKPYVMERRAGIFGAAEAFLLCYKKRTFEHDSTPGISDIIIYTVGEKLPHGYTILDKSHCGRDANLGTKKEPKYFAIKKECHSKPGLDEDPVIQVCYDYDLEDLQVHLS